MNIFLREGVGDGVNFLTAFLKQTESIWRAEDTTEKTDDWFLFLLYAVFAYFMSSDMRVYVPPRPLNHDPSFVVERLGANPYFGTLRETNLEKKWP